MTPQSVCSMVDEAKRPGFERNDHAQITQRRRCPSLVSINLSMMSQELYNIPLTGLDPRIVSYSRVFRWYPFQPRWVYLFAARGDIGKRAYRLRSTCGEQID